MPRLLFDFPPAPGDSPVRRTFTDPLEVVRARTIEDVVPALERVERAVLNEGLSAAGYLAYEAAPAFDSAFRVRPDATGPLLWFGLFDGSGAPVASPPPNHSTDPDLMGPWTLDVSPEAFAGSVARIHRAIEGGESYQVNYTARYRARSTTSSRRSIYEQLRASQGDGYHALLELGDQTIVSASPELFFQLRGREVTVRPMKGTRPRGRWLEEDDALARELRRSEKEQAENRMIVDLLRNDLGRVAETGSVKVPRVFDVERYRTVLQMTSTVTGTLPPGAGFVAVLRALFPSGSVTGAPKIQTMKLIAELESSPREVYCGAIGYVEGGSGDAVFNVPIRTLRIDRSSATATYGTGSGITWSSTAEEEFEEMRAKARILSERWPDFDLLETLRLEDGAYRRLERHLTRIGDSARYFDRPFPEESVRSALKAEASAHPEGPWRVRITLSEAGEVQADATPLPPEAVGTDVVTPEAPEPEAGHSDAAGSGAHRRQPLGSNAPKRSVTLASSPVDSANRFLFHKTTHRAVYDSHRAAHPDMFDVLLWNEKGEITEFCRGNVVVERDGRRVTPARSCGLLAGCFRQELLEGGLVDEGRITRSEVADVERLWLVNSVRGWVPVSLSLLYELSERGDPFSERTKASDKLEAREGDEGHRTERLQRQDDA